MCEMAIEFEPTDDLMPRLLARIEDCGFILRGLRLIPTCQPGRSTLHIDLGGWSRWEELRELETGLASVDPTISVIQLAQPGQSLQTMAA